MVFVLFLFVDRSLYASPAKIGMYDTARWIVASYLMSQGKDPNLTHLDGSTEGDIEPALQTEIIEALKEAHFDEFGNDALKRNVASGSLDLCFTQLGDFFDALYLAYSEGKNEIDFNVNVPSTSAAFFDAMVIPTTCQNETPTAVNERKQYLLLNSKKLSEFYPQFIIHNSPFIIIFCKTKKA